MDIRVLGLVHAGLEAILEAAQAVLEQWHAELANKLQPGGLQASSGTHMLCRQERQTHESSMFERT